jgi:hypothetical protein
MGLSSSPLDREAVVLVRYFVLVSRSSIHRARSAWADCGPPVNPISCAARRRIRAIENCVSRLLPSLVQRQVTMLVALAERLNPTSRRATLQPPLAYCVTEFGRLSVRPTRDKVRVNYEAAARHPRHRAICSARHDSSRRSAGMECERARRLGGLQIYSAGSPLQLLTGDSYGRPTPTLQGKA